MEDTFVEAARCLSADEDLREKISRKNKDVEVALAAVQEKIHEAHFKLQWAASPDQEELLRLVGLGISAIAEIIPTGSYYRYHDIFRGSLSVAVYCVVTLRFLSTCSDSRSVGTADLPSLSEIHAALALTMQDWITIEDYLLGLCNCSNEIARLCITRVTLGDFAFPHKAFQWTSELFAGFRLLNFRNDTLRRRFDGIKYDVKRISEVQYDLVIRGISQASANPSAEGAASADLLDSHTK
uniref:Translin n=1 Tax=Compsopogon caeruleus TaxID=31354 RepID=A0A7S1TEL1_9RHOD